MKNLCNAYKDYDGQPVNTSQQMDVDEYFNMLFDKLETCLKGTPQEKLLTECFGGKVVNQIICRDAVRVGNKVYGEDNPFKSQREESFYTLQLQVKHKRNILESLDLFVEGEVLEGDNKYFCEEANQRVDAVKRVCIRQLPRTLILHLKRFEFDLDFMKKVKVNDSCEFPRTLDMDPYTLDGIERREKAAAEATKAGLDASQAVSQVPSPSDRRYELVGVLVHTGTADSGHYYSFIKDRTSSRSSSSNSHHHRYHAGGEGNPAAGDEGGASSKQGQGKWFLFNDMHVEHFDEKEIGAQCFGGSEYVAQDALTGGGQQQRSGGPKCVPRIYNAYMLFYERVGLAQEREDDTQRRGEVPLEILREVWEENIQFLHDKLLYDLSYFGFAHQVVVIGSAQTQARRTLDVLRLCVSFLMDTVLHSWEVSQTETWVNVIIKLLSEDQAGVERCEWLLDSFCLDVASGHSSNMPVTAHWLREGLLVCKVPEARTHIVRMLVHAIRVIATVRPEPAAADYQPGMRVPHCLPAFPQIEVPLPDDDETYFDLYGEQPLLTDTPNERMYPGGYDPKLKPPFDYQPFPRACTSTGVFIDKVLSLLPDVSHYWRNFKQYWMLLAEIAKVGRAEKLFLLSRRAVARCIDIFLHEESPFKETHSCRLRVGDKFTQPSYFHLIDMIAELLCSTSLAEHMEDMDYEDEEDLESFSPVQLEEVGPLDIACFKLVTSPVFLNKALSQDLNLRAFQRLAVMLCWRNSQISSLVISTACEVLEEASEEDYPALFDVLSTMVHIGDEIPDFRAERFVCFFARAILENLQYPEMCTRCIDLVTNLCENNYHVRASIAKSLFHTQSRKVCGFWFSKCMFAPFDSIRSSAEVLARVLIYRKDVAAAASLREPAPAAVAERDASLSPSAGQQQRVAQSVDDMPEDAFEVFRYLLAMIKEVENLVQPVAVQRAQSPFRLAQYFRALAAIVSEGNARMTPGQPPPFGEMLQGHIGNLVRLLDAMNDQLLDVDWNRCVRGM